MQQETCELLQNKTYSHNMQGKEVVAAHLHAVLNSGQLAALMLLANL
jgi:hypothetical protein